MELKTCRGCGNKYGDQRTDFFVEKAREVGERKFELTDTEGRSETLIEALMLLRFLAARIKGWCSPACRDNRAKAQLQRVANG